MCPYFHRYGVTDLIMLVPRQKTEYYVLERSTTQDVFASAARASIRRNVAPREALSGAITSTT
jgi:hypothetical protein